MKKASLKTELGRERETLFDRMCLSKEVGQEFEELRQLIFLKARSFGLRVSFPQGSKPVPMLL